MSKPRSEGMTIDLKISLDVDDFLAEVKMGEVLTWFRDEDILETMDEDTILNYVESWIGHEADVSKILNTMQYFIEVEDILNLDRPEFIAELADKLALSHGYTKNER